MRKYSILGLLVLAWGIIAPVSSASASIVDNESDLHLDPTMVVSAVTFGGVDQIVGGVQFYGSGRNATVNGVTNASTSTYYLGRTGWRPEVADLLGSNLWCGVFGTTGQSAYSVTVGDGFLNPLPSGTYQVQMLMYEGWVADPLRVADISVEGKLVADDFDYYAQQGGGFLQGTIITTVVDVSDSMLNIDLATSGTPGEPGPHLSGLVLSTAVGATPGTTVKLFDEESDLDNTNVVRAVNFGSKYPDAPPVVNGVAFTYSANNTTVADDVTNDAAGVINYCNTYPQTIGVEGIFGGLIADISDPKVVEIDVDVSGEAPGTFEVQLVMYEGWGDASTNRQCDVTMEGMLVADDYTYYTEQGSSFLDGSVITQQVYCDDGNIDIEIAAVSYDALVSAIIVHREQSVQIPGDATGDDKVDDADAQTLAANWGATGVGWLQGDFDGDTIVGPTDASILAANWGYGTSESTSSVPEPGVVVTLLGMAGLALLWRQEWKR